MPSAAIFEKTMKVVKSCKTIAQINIANNYFQLAKKHLIGNEINQILIIMRIQKDKILKI